MGEKVIDFVFINNWECMLESQFNGCCCKCKNQLKVYAHCCHVKHDDDQCNCGDEMGFNVCTLFGDAENEYKASISGDHGLCECYI